MKQRQPSTFKAGALLAALLFLIGIPARAWAEAPPGAIAAFNSYAATVEAQLAHRHQVSATFLMTPNSDIRHGAPLIEVLPTPTVSGALLHHWRGTAFVPGASATDFERLLKNFGDYPRIYAPQVLQAKVLSRQGDHLTASMRVRQKHVLTVVLDTSYDVTFSRLDPQHGSSFSRSTHIAEIDSPDTPSERELTSAQEHGFLWRLNTYWSYEERDGGLYIQIESVTLTRSIPHGLAWAVGPFVESIPRESLEFTLRATAHALHT